MSRRQRCIPSVLVPTATWKVGRATTTGSRRSPNHSPKTPCIQGVGDPTCLIRPRVYPDSARARSTSGKYLATTSNRLGRQDSASTRLPNSACNWVILSGQTTPDRDDYCPTCPWAGDPNDKKSLENARKVRLAMNLAVNKKAIISGLWKGMGDGTPFSYYYYPFHKGYSADWKIPPYDPEGAKKLLAEAGQSGGFEVRVNPHGHGLRGPMGPTSWRRSPSIGRRSGSSRKRFPEMTSTFGPKLPSAQDQQDTLGLWLAAVRRAHPRLEPRAAFQGRLQPALRRPVRRGHRDRPWQSSMSRSGRGLSPALGQKLYDDYRGVMLGVRSITWATSPQGGQLANACLRPARNELRVRENRQLVIGGGGGGGARKGNRLGEGGGGPRARGATGFPGAVRALGGMGGRWRGPRMGTHG